MLQHASSLLIRLAGSAPSPLGKAWSASPPIGITSYHPHTGFFTHVSAMFFIPFKVYNHIHTAKVCYNTHTKHKRGSFNMNNILKDLWYGNIAPCERCGVGNTKLNRLIRDMERVRLKLSDTLSPQQA